MPGIPIKSCGLDIVEECSSSIGLVSELPNSAWCKNENIGNVLVYKRTPRVESFVSTYYFLIHILFNS